MPTTVRMRSSDDALSEDEIDDEDQHHASGHENLGRNGQSDVRGSCRPCYPQDAAGDSGHAKTEQHGRHDEFMSSLFVDLEDCHVGYGADDE